MFFNIDGRLILASLNAEEDRGTDWPPTVDISFATIYARCVLV